MRYGHDLNYNHPQDRYVIEARNADGGLDFTAPQPESVFGEGAIDGLTTDEIAKAVLSVNPEAVLRGYEIEGWPSKIDPRWRARLRTW